MKFRFRRTEGKRSNDLEARSSSIPWSQIIAVIGAIASILVIALEDSSSIRVERYGRPDTTRSVGDTVAGSTDTVLVSAWLNIPGPRSSTLDADLGVARVRYSAFDSLFVDEPKFFSVSILPYVDSLGNFREPRVLDERGDPYAETDSVRVGSVMRAELAGSDFEIQPTVDTSDQPVLTTEPTVWAWMVEPKEVGVKELVLTLSVVVDVEGQRLPKVLRVFRQSIHVVAVVPSGQPVEFKTAAAFQSSPAPQQDTNSLRDATDATGTNPTETNRSSTPQEAYASSAPDTGEIQGVAKPSDEDMSAGLIGVIFLGILLLFLMVAYYHPPNSPYAYSILKLISAICGGFAGGFLMGEAVVEISNDSAAGGLQYALSGTAGFGLFLLIWVFFPKPPAEPAPLPVGENGYNFRPPDGCTFEQAAKLIAQSRKAVARLEEFSEGECQIVLDAQEIHANDAAHALRLLRDLAPRGQIRAYEVKYSDSVYHLRVENTTLGAVHGSERV